jgi:hypothetical protein
MGRILQFIGSLFKSTEQEIDQLSDILHKTRQYKDDSDASTRLLKSFVGDDLLLNLEVSMLLKTLEIELKKNPHLSKFREFLEYSTYVVVIGHCILGKLGENYLSGFGSTPKLMAKTEESCFRQRHRINFNQINSEKLSSALFLVFSAKTFWATVGYPLSHRFRITEREVWARDTWLKAHENMP